MDTPAEPIDIPKPEYPPEFRNEGRCGSVVLDYMVGVDGRAEPGSISVARASMPAFSFAAINAIQGGRFAPAKKAGIPVRQRVHQTITFRVGKPATGPDCT